jgi:hypothetical protein
MAALWWRRSREWNRERPADADEEPPAGVAAAAAAGAARREGTRPGLAPEGVRDLREVLSSRRSAGLERGARWALAWLSLADPLLYPCP